MLDCVGLGTKTQPGGQERDMAAGRTGDTARYEIRIRSELGDSWSDWLGPDSQLSRSDGDTVLVGELDQAALHAVLRRVRDLGLPLISVRRVGTAQTPPPASDAPSEDSL